jgi:hypothetical protein
VRRPSGLKSAHHRQAILTGAAGVYDSAIEDLKSAGIPFEETAKSEMANRILAAITDGERDSNRLMQYALEAINASRSPAPGRDPSPTRSA